MIFIKLLHVNLNSFYNCCLASLPSMKFSFTKQTKFEPTLFTLAVVSIFSNDGCSTLNIWTPISIFFLLMLFNKRKLFIPFKHFLIDHISNVNFRNRNQTLRTNHFLKLSIHNWKLYLFLNTSFTKIMHTSTQNDHALSWSVFIANQALMIWVLKFKYKMLMRKRLDFFKLFLPRDLFLHLWGILF